MGLDIRVGDVILAVDHRRLTEELTPDAALSDLAGKEIMLTVRRPSTQAETAQLQAQNAAPSSAPAWLSFTERARARLAAARAAAAGGSDVLSGLETLSLGAADGAAAAGCPADEAQVQAQGKKKRNRGRKGGRGRGTGADGLETGSSSAWLEGTNVEAGDAGGNAGGCKRSTGGRGNNGADNASDVHVGSMARLRAERWKYGLLSPYASGGMLTVTVPGVEPGTSSRAVRVTPVSAEQLTAARYRDWVHDKQKIVHAETAGHVGEDVFMRTKQIWSDKPACCVCHLADSPFLSFCFARLRPCPRAGRRRFCRVSSVLFG